jgi:hypothetical protein
MPSPNVSDDSIEALCNMCGKTFSVFLHQMADQNAKVVCPDCRAAIDCEPVKDAKPGARARSVKKII